MAKAKKDKVIEIVNKHPEGLTIQSVSRLGKMSRITATIYLHELLGEGKVSERKIGAYRMFFPKGKFLKAVNKQEIIDKLKKSL